MSIRSDRFRHGVLSPAEIVAVETGRANFPTPTVNGGKNNAGPSQWGRHSAALNVAVKWPTPSHRDFRAGQTTPHGGGNKTPQRNLNDVVLFPTPTVRDHASAGPCDLRRHSAKLVSIVSYPTPRVNSLCGGTGAWNAIHGNPALTADEKRAMTSSAGRGDFFDTPTAHGDGGSGRKGNVPKFAQLNPDWVEWLMGWPVGWTDPECDRPWPFLPLGEDPADLPPTMPGYVPRTTMRRKHRPARIRAIGNGQVPQCAAAAFRMGLDLLNLGDTEQ